VAENDAVSCGRERHAHFLLDGQQLRGRGHRVTGERCRECCTERYSSQFNNNCLAEM
jgi:hypothetical protein